MVFSYFAATAGWALSAICVFAPMRYDTTMTNALKRQIMTTVRQVVAESLHTALTDPDYGLELTPVVRSRLAQYRQQKTHRLTSLAAVRRRFA